MNTKIPCSVIVLTKNSATTLERALASVNEFSDIVVCDGGSTDKTADIARAHGARVIMQDMAFLDADGRIKDFSGVRNQGIAAATEQWVLCLDSDEYASGELVEDIRRATSGEPQVYWVPRKYVLRGVTIERSITYPNRQMRFFHRAAVEGYRKQVHERLVLRDGAHVGQCTGAILVPADTTVAEQRAKSARYIAIDIARMSPLTLRTRARVVLHGCKGIILYVLRMVRLMFPPYHGARMPRSGDWEVIRYQLVLMWRAVTTP